VSEQRHFLPFRHRKSNHRNKKIANPMNNKTLQPLNRRRRFGKHGNVFGRLETK
jgi:hypothetical protein